MTSHAHLPTYLPFLAVLLLVGGCGSDAPNRASSSAAATGATGAASAPKAKGAPAGTPTAPAGATGSACPAEHTAVAEGGFCVKVPKAWEAEPPKKRGETTEFAWFRKGEGGLFVVALEPGKELPADLEATIAKSKEPQTITKGELAGGRGRWLLALGEKGKSSSLYQVALAGPKGLLRCGASTDADSAKKELELCQTLLPLGP